MKKKKLFYLSPVHLLIMFLGPGEFKEVNNDMIFLLRFINFAFCCHLSCRVPRVIISH